MYKIRVFFCLFVFWLMTQEKIQKLLFNFLVVNCKSFQLAFKGKTKFRNTHWPEKNIKTGNYFVKLA